MKLEEIKNWEEIKSFLDDTFGPHKDKNCQENILNHSCKNCIEYYHLINYQQKRAQKYDKKSPRDTWKKSFNDTLNYMNARYK